MIIIIFCSSRLREWGGPKVSSECWMAKIEYYKVILLVRFSAQFYSLHGGVDTG